MITREIKDNWQELLWTHLYDYHDVTATQTELEDIKSCIVEFDPEKETEELRDKMKLTEK